MKFELPNTSYIVLGLLASGEALSGYEIRKRAQNLKHFYWSPAQSQIYKELRRLEQHALASSAFVEQQGKPNKQLFQVTEDGTAVFKQWLNHAELPPTVLKHPVLLKLYFAQFTEPDALISLLNEFIQNSKEQLSQLYIVEEFLEMDPNSELSSLVIEWSIHHQKSEIQIAQQLMQRLTQQ
ncbi:MAG: helix-turn-helix transcriptional regulator [Chloroflexota bacterium]